MDSDCGWGMTTLGCGGWKRVGGVLCLDAETTVLLDLAHDEGALDGGDVGDVAEVVEDELLVVLHVAGAYLEQIVVGAAGVVALDDLRQTLDAPREVVRQFAVDLLEFHFAENEEAETETLGIQNGCIAAYVALAFEPSLAFKHGGGGEIYGIGQFFGTQFCILLQGAEQLEVYFVGIFHF